METGGPAKITDWGQPMVVAVKRVARPSCHRQGCGLCMYEGVGELSISGSINLGKFELLGNKKRNDPNIIIIHKYRE
jgi:hypothetical protein